jgi:hypothetical protein
MLNTISMINAIITVDRRFFMTNIYFSGNRALTLIASVSLISLLTACGGANNESYTSNGSYSPMDTPHNTAANTHSSPADGTGDHRSNRRDDNDSYYDDSHYEINRYGHNGYYERNGYYVARNSGVAVPQEMFPPQGMCRMWFMERLASDQPDVESCNGIRSRAPNGAYIIYGS